MSGMIERRNANFEGNAHKDHAEDRLAFFVAIPAGFIGFSLVMQRQGFQLHPKGTNILGKFSLFVF
jgi:hypothetical protein